MRKPTSRLGDWGLKLLALILALVIYHALKTETQNPSTKVHDKVLFKTH